MHRKVGVTSGFYEEVNGIYRLRVPFDCIYTSVFLIRGSEGTFLVDSATTADDVDKCIVPSLNALGIKITDIDGIIITHSHSDHSGGLTRILSYVPNVEVIRHEQWICSNVLTYSMPGHTPDCLGVLDVRSHTLISADGLQGAGVGKYRCYVEDKSDYISTIEKISDDERIENILFSHEYEPWYTDCILGRLNVKKCLCECKKYVNGEEI